MNTENGTETEETTEETTPPSAPEIDHKAIADEIFNKQEEQKKQEAEEKKRKEQGLPEIKLSDEDHKGIATHLKSMMDADTPPEPAKEEKKEKKGKEVKPEPHKNLFDRPLFRLGGKG